MKTVNVTFEDAEHERLIKAKDKSGFKSWHDFMLGMI